MHFRPCKTYSRHIQCHAFKGPVHWVHRKQLLNIYACQRFAVDNENHLFSFVRIPIVLCFTCTFYLSAMGLRCTIGCTLYNFHNKKLRYREEHSASVVLSWCTLWHLSLDNQQLANHFYVTGHESYRIPQNNAKLWPSRSSRSFKVTDFGTNRKHIYDLLLVINTNLPTILHRFRVTAVKFSLTINRRALRFNALAGGDPLRISP